MENALTASDIATRDENGIHSVGQGKRSKKPDLNEEIC